MKTTSYSLHFLKALYPSPMHRAARTFFLGPLVTLGSHPSLGGKMRKEQGVNPRAFQVSPEFSKVSCLGSWGGPQLGGVISDLQPSPRPANWFFLKCKSTLFPGFQACGPNRMEGGEKEREV